MLRRTLFTSPCRASPRCIKALTPTFSSSYSRRAKAAAAAAAAADPDSQLLNLVKSKDKHNDLASFEAYAEETGLDPNSTVYRGTYYEYIVANALFHKNMRLGRTGGRSDRGIDLRGEWHIPLPRPHALPEDLDSPEAPLPPITRCMPISVIVQCKANTNMPLGPNIIRELSGTLAYTTNKTIGFVASMYPCTGGARDAIRFSPKPMGYACISENGVIKQLVWNKIVSRLIGSGLGVGVRYTNDASQKTLDGELEQEVVLMFDGETVDDLFMRELEVERPLTKRLRDILKKVKIKK